MEGGARELFEIVKRGETTETAQVRAVHPQLALLWVSGSFSWLMMLLRASINCHDISVICMQINHLFIAQ